MKNSSEKNNADSKCIWMLAGIINYKLCDQSFQCDRCEFNKVMQGMLPHNVTDPDIVKSKKIDDATSNLVNRYLYSLFSDCQIYLDRYYHYSYFWYKIESENTVLVGIDKLLIKILEPIDKIILPEVQETFCKGQLMAWIVRKGKALPLYSPIRGKVIEINKTFENESFKQVLAEDAYFFKMKEKGIGREVQQLCTDMLGLECFIKKVNLIRNHLINKFHLHLPADIGTTLADGGIIQMNLEKVLGEESFQELLNQLLIGDKNKIWNDFR